MFCPSYFQIHILNQTAFHSPRLHLHLLTSLLQQPPDCSSCFHSSPLTPGTISTADILKLNGECYLPVWFSYEFTSPWGKPYLWPSRHNPGPSHSPTLSPKFCPQITAFWHTGLLSVPQTPVLTVFIVIPSSWNALPTCLHLAASPSLSFRSQSNVISSAPWPSYLVVCTASTPTITSALFYYP